LPYRDIVIYVGGIGGVMSCYYNCPFYIPETWDDPAGCSYTGEPPYPCDENDDREPETDDGLGPDEMPWR